MMRNYRNIKAFQIADVFVKEVYVQTRTFPREEQYGLTSQIRRAAVSVAANIVEGASRQHKRDYLHFLYISRGSLAEVEYLLHLAHALEYFNEDVYAKAESLCREAACTLFGLIKSVEKETKIVSRVLALFTSMTALAVLKAIRTI